MRVRVLGQLSVIDGGTELPAADLPRRARQVLAVLAARHDRIQSKDALADAVWGDDLPGNHVAALEHYVSVLRRRLQPAASAATYFIVTRSGGYLFDTGRAELDLAVLRRRVRDLDTLTPGTPERLAVHESILELARELPFPEDPYAEWADAARTEVQIAAVNARLEIATAGLERDATRSMRLAQEAIELNPFLEPAYRAAMDAAVAMGRPDDALRFFERCRKVLSEELGVAPSQELLRLHREIRAERTVEPEPPARVVPVRAAVPAGHEQRPAERFLGRISHLRVLVEPDPPKVVHIVGPHGAGKTEFLAEISRHLIGRVGIGYAGMSTGVHRLAWLRTALQQLDVAPEVLAVVDAAPADMPLQLTDVELIGAALARPEPVFLAVDDAADLDRSSVAELAWLSRHCRHLHLVLTYCYPSEIRDKPLAGLGTAVVLRLEPLTERELEPLGDATVLARTGGIPALVSVVHRPYEISAGVGMQTARLRTRWMPEPAWDVLRYCAALGPLAPAELAVLTGQPESAVLACVDQLVHAHLLIEVADGQVGHRSSLIRDAVADQMSDASSRHLRDRLQAAAG
jgi:DNA-binding SARP family transcriptional activator